MTNHEMYSFTAAKQVKERVKTVETYLFANIFNQIVWSEKGSPTYPLGWRLGFYKNETGTLNYRTTNNKYISTVNAWSFTDNNEVRIKCPDGYKIRYSVYDISGVYSGEYSEYYNELVFTPETDKRYKFSINGFNEDAEDYVANSAFLATIDGRIIVSPSRATRIDQLINKQDTKPSMKILAIGNSWCRDSVRWLWNILDEAGYNAKIVQAYMGGSSLYHQYFGINDPDYSYTHSSWQQKTHNTFQSWTYTSESPVLSPPSSDYANGQNGIGLTLQEIVESDTWDYVVVMGTHSYIASRKQYVDTGLSNTYINSNNETVTETWDINDFITKIKSWCTNQPKVFFMTAWSISKNTVGTSWTNATEHYTDLWTQAEQDRTAFYELLNNSIDTSLKFGLYHMGDIIDGCINLAKALYYARQNEYLSLFGFDMQRTESNTHLADGLPMYLCSFTIANSLFGIRANDIFAVPNFGNRNNNIDTDAGEEDVSSVSETKGIVYMAKCCGEKANHNTIA